MQNHERGPVQLDRKNGTARLILIAFGIGLLILCLQLGVDWLYVEQRRVLFSDVFMALSSSVVCFFGMRYYYRQRQAALTRLDAVAKINHHVRNALYTIGLSVYVKGDPELTTIVQDSITRIDSVLRENLDVPKQKLPSPVLKRADGAPAAQR